MTTTCPTWKFNKAGLWFLHSLKGEKGNDLFSAIHWKKKFHIYQWCPLHITTRSRLTFPWYESGDVSKMQRHVWSMCAPCHALACLCEATTLSACFSSELLFISKDDIFHQLHTPSRSKRNCHLGIMFIEMVHSVIDFKTIRIEADLCASMHKSNILAAKPSSNTILLSFWPIS